jgi:fucose permease
MFMMFAMTTDSVGTIIPEVIKEFHLSMVAAGAFHYAPMVAIAVAAIFLGYLADKLGRKKTIILGLVLFALNSYLFAVGNSFPFFLTLLVISGASIGIFKTGALALVGDISRSTSEHTTTMNTVEGFFGVGAIIGPAIVARLLTSGLSWKWLYVIAGTICVLLILTALLVKYPKTVKTMEEPIDFKRTMRMMKNPYALGFSLGIFLYVAAECAVYVWMPTLLTGYSGSFVFMATYAISVFFILRAIGRFLGAWVLARFSWTSVMALFSLAILICFAGAMVHDLSDTQFEGYQLFPENGAWCRCRRDPIFHLRRCGSGAFGHGSRQRRIRPSQVWPCPGNHIRSAYVRGIASQLDIQPGQRASGKAGFKRILRRSGQWAVKQNNCRRPRARACQRERVLGH